MPTPSLFRLRLTASAVFWSALLSAQTPSEQASPAQNGTFQRVQFSEPAVPPDPLELVTGDAQPVQTVEQRSAVMNALSNAWNLSNVRAYPYDRKTTFTSFGSTATEGIWQMEDTSPGGRIYRWTAQGPSYSATNLFNNQTLYSTQTGVAPIPVRLAQVRSAIFFMRPVIGPRATLRTAAANVNGVAVDCVLLSHMQAAKDAAGGRRWEEEEYCVDKASGLLITYSPAPGLYVLYDYSQALHFHDRLIPNKFTITQAGRTMIEAQTTAVGDPPKDPLLYQPNGMNQTGVGSLMTSPWIMNRRAPSALVSPGAADLVVLHGMKSKTGQIGDIELLATSNNALTPRAMDYALKWQQSNSEDVEPGATPLSHEVIMMFTFFGAPR